MTRPHCQAQADLPSATLRAQPEGACHPEEDIEQQKTANRHTLLIAVEFGFQELLPLLGDTLHATDIQIAGSHTFRGAIQEVIHLLLAHRLLHAHAQLRISHT